MKLVLSLIIFLLIIPSAFSQKGWRDGEMEVKITISTAGEASRLYNLHLIGDFHCREGFATMYVIPEEFEKIKETGLRAEIIKNNLNEYYLYFWSDRS